MPADRHDRRVVVRDRLERWRDIWLNEGFASYTEWLWAEREGYATAQQIFDSRAEVPADDPFWQLTIGDPGPDRLFFPQVYERGAMTLHALRGEVGDATFFRILRAWSWSQRGDVGRATASASVTLTRRSRTRSHRRAAPACA